MYAFVITLLLNANPIVSVPILPTNIVSIKIYLDVSVKPAVIPVDKPTVPNADTSSNNIRIIAVSGSRIASKKVEMNIKDAEKINIEKALFNNSQAILCRNNSRLRLPLKVAIDETIINVNVDVLIPPPVDPDDAPMNIKKIMRIRVGT